MCASWCACPSSQEAVAKAVTAAQLGEAELQKRYHQQIADYTTLHVDHILVDSEAKAQAIYDQVTAPGFTAGRLPGVGEEGVDRPQRASGRRRAHRCPPASS